MGSTSTTTAPTGTKGPERLGPVIGYSHATEKSAVYGVGVIPWNKSDPASRPTTAPSARQAASSTW